MDATTKAAADEMVRRAKAKWGAGWDRISEDMKRDAIAAEVAYSVIAHDKTAAVMFRAAMDRAEVG